MIELPDIKDRYNRRARLRPALIVALPIGLAIQSWSPDGLRAWTVLWGLFVWAGGTALMVQLARDRGRREETTLFRDWGGKPTTHLLRYSGSDNSILVARRHSGLQRVLRDLHLPSESEESANPVHADNVYDTCVRWLLEHTRDEKKFPLVFEENCNYGFRRNLWGMKPIGLAITIGGILVGLVGAAFRMYAHASISPVSYGAIACDVGLLLFWVCWCNPDWVKLTAEAYAERLVAVVDTLDPGMSKPRIRAQKSGVKES